MVLERGESEREMNADCCGVDAAPMKPYAEELCRDTSGSGTGSAVETCLEIARVGDEGRRVTEGCLVTA